MQQRNKSPTPLLTTPNFRKTRLAMKDELRGVLLVLDVPHEGDTVGFVRRLLVVVVASDKQLWVLEQ